ncbi:MAG: acyl-[acyl-carrier-protein] thioesterase [Balneola sp.]|nr:acyl-[acyl-carrier-protein] thioesterase [Balneola sp.]
MNHEDTTHTDNSRIHGEFFSVRASETAPDECMHLSALARLFQEVAGNNAKELSFDITDMHAQNMSWVLNRLQIQIERLPKWRENIEIRTWPALGDSLKALRNYEVWDNKGDLIVQSISYWMVIDLDSRKPIRIPKDILTRKFSDRPHTLKPTKNRLRAFDPSDAEQEITMQSYAYHLDMNNHVNNTHYIDWMLEILQSNQRQSLRWFDLVFLNELSSYMPVRVQSKDDRIQLLNTELNAVALAQWF